MHTLEPRSSTYLDPVLRGTRSTPGLEPVLLDQGDTGSRPGTAAALPDVGEIREAVRRAGLLGAGGAGFPTATKMDAVAASPGPRVLVVNAEEGEPSSVKDRWLLRHRTDLLLNGAVLAAHGVAAERIVVYASDPGAAAQVRAAVSGRRPGSVPIEVELFDPAYVAGEETSVVNHLNGGEAKPLPKPPRPYEAGVGGRPTLVLNAETTARIAVALDPAIGPRAGQTLLTTLVCGDTAVLVESERGAPLAEVAALHPDPRFAEAPAYLVGGFAGGVWGPEILRVPVSHEAFREAGALWGCGSIIAIPAADCVIDACLDVARYLHRSSSGQCGACVRGTEVVVQHLARVAAGTGSQEDLAALAKRAQSLPGRGNCALPDADAALIRTMLDRFAPELQAHLTEPCDTCAGGSDSGDTRYRVRLEPDAATQEASR